MVVGIQFELQDKKKLWRINEERKLLQSICNSWQSKEKNSEN